MAVSDHLLHRANTFHTLIRRLDDGADVCLELVIAGLTFTEGTTLAILTATYHATASVGQADVLVVERIAPDIWSRT